jgi:hypothetical protein
LAGCAHVILQWAAGDKGASVIFAEIHGKLGADYSRAHERAEDLLTSTVLGLLRYIPLNDGLLAVLRLVYRVQLEPGVTTAVIRRDPSWILTDRVKRVKYDFWPYWRGYGEPDVLLTFYDASDKALLQIIIEAKLGAPKSGRAGEDAGDLAEDDVPDPDQLVRYWQKLQQMPEVGGGAIPRLIYLTKHTAPPFGELTESLRRAPSMQLGWLSWTHVWEAVEKFARSDANCLPASDLARLLAHKGFKNFDGFHAAPWKAPAQSTFWKRSRWFTRLQPWISTCGKLGFWKTRSIS